MGSALTVRFGLDEIISTGGQSCVTTHTALAAPTELAVATHPRGPFHPIAVGLLRTATWTPDQPGVFWLRVVAQDKAVPPELRAVVVGSGEVPLDPRYRGLRAELFDPDTPDGHQRAQLTIPADSRTERLVLPRAPAWWWLQSPAAAWAEVRADGSVAVTAAPASVHFTLPEITVRGWEVSVEAAGMPTRAISCRGECVVSRLPPGAAQLRIRAAAAGIVATPAATIDLPLTIDKRSGEVPELCATALLRGGPIPVGGCGSFLLQPRWREIPAAPGDTADQTEGCLNARPIDGPSEPLAIGHAVCVRRGARWEQWLVPPREVVRGGLVATTRRGQDVLWVEETNAGSTARAVLYAASPAGLLLEQIPIAPPYPAVCHVRTLHVTDGGDPVVGGDCEQTKGARGFVAVRAASGWVKSWTDAGVTSVRPHSAAVLAVDGAGAVWRCTPRCQQVGRAAEPLVGIDGEAHLLGRSGAVYTSAPRLHQLLPPPKFAPLFISQVLDSTAGSVALFGPLFSGSEYHPYCVASIVAWLGPQGWQELHRVSGSGGRTLDCQDDDSHPVVIELAATAQQLHARYRRRFAGVSLPFAPLLALPVSK